MNKKNFMVIMLCVLAMAVAVLVLIPSFYVSEIKLPKEIFNTQEIVFSNEMSIVRRDGIWCSKSDDFYPVNNDTVDNLLDNLQKSALHAEECRNECDGENKINLVAKDGKSIELLFDYGGENVKKLVAVTGRKKMMLKGKFSFPMQPYQWFVQPLINLNNADIEEISGAEPVSFDFKDLIFYQATKNADIEKWENRQIEIVMKNGLIINLTIYSEAHSYWLAVRFETTVMPTKEAVEYIKNNGSLYSGWFFELPQPIGNRLFGL